MAALSAKKIARQMDETDLQILQIIVENFSSVLEFSDKWIRAACENQDILLCDERLAKFANFGIIERDDSRKGSDEEGVYFLRNVGLANGVFKQAGVRAGK